MGTRLIATRPPDGQTAAPGATVVAEDEWAKDGRASWRFAVG